MIEVKGVTKSFDDFTALDNVTCNIAEGCIYGMVGSNGAGKSRLLRVLSGIYIHRLPRYGKRLYHRGRRQLHGL